jgi:hypothetical protein
MKTKSAIAGITLTLMLGPLPATAQTFAPFDYYGTPYFSQPVTGPGALEAGLNYLANYNYQGLYFNLYYANNFRELYPAWASTLTSMGSCIPGFTVGC